MEKFRVVEHMADIGLEAFGRSLNEVFQNAAFGMFRISCSNLEDVLGKKCLDVELEADNKESLIVEWLNELLYLFETEKILFATFDIIEVTEKELHARVCGEEIDLSRHEIETQIKACTYHMTEVTKNELWHAKVLFDV